MPVVEGSVEIAAPRQTVWEFMADPSRHTELGTFVDEVTLVTKGEIGEGTVYHERRGDMDLRRGRLRVHPGDPVSRFSDDAWIPTSGESA